jgi:hypothetical protein
VARDPCGGFDVHRLEGFIAVLDIEANRVDDAISAGNGRRNGCLVVDVRHRRLQTWLFHKKNASAVRMPRGNPH